MPNCADAAKQVKSSLAPFMRTTNKAGDTIKEVSTKMASYMKPINDTVLDNYYEQEKAQFEKNLKTYKTNIARYPDQLRKQEIAYNKFKIFGDPNSNKTTIPGKLKKYRDNLERNFTDIADNIKSTSLAQHENYNKDIQTMILYYKSQEEYAARMKNMLDIKNTEHKKLEDELEELLKKSLTNNRKAIYEDYEIESLNSTRKILYYIYYIVFVLYLIFGNFFTDKQYRNVTVWVLIVLYLTVPVYIKYICNGIIYLYREFLYIKDNKLPKNVYTGL